MSKKKEQTGASQDNQKKRGYTHKSLNYAVFVVAALLFIALVVVTVLLNQQAQAPANEQKKVSAERSVYTSGESRYSQGVCRIDDDCFVGGCSGEVCANEPGVITTCEILPDFPDTQRMHCGCVDGMCGWVEEHSDRINTSAEVSQ